MAAAPIMTSIKVVAVKSGERCLGIYFEHTAKVIFLVEWMQCMRGEELTMIPRPCAYASRRVEMSFTFTGKTAGSTSFSVKGRSSVLNMLSLRC